MDKTVKQVLAYTPKEWREWLRINHGKEDKVYLVRYKRHTKNETFNQSDAMDEAICFGWIDSIVKRIDDEKYCQKFTPRNETSIWSELNKKRVAKMIKLGKMTKVGMDKIIAAKRNGKWETKSAAAIEYKMPDELTQLLSKNKVAREFFESLTKSCKKQYIGWIASAKKEETRLKRAEEAIRLLTKKQKLGLR